VQVSSLLPSDRIGAFSPALDRARTAVILEGLPKLSFRDIERLGLTNFGVDPLASAAKARLPAPISWILAPVPADHGLWDLTIVIACRIDGKR
jgi:hypothetical protein